MFNRKIADSKSPCLNCIERWIDIENMKRCDSHCDKRDTYLKSKTDIPVYSKNDSKYIDTRLNKRYNKVNRDRNLLYSINEEKYK